MLTRRTQPARFAVPPKVIEEKAHDLAPIPSPWVAVEALDQKRCGFAAAVPEGSVQ
ncbi:MAG TPA: hypothetical protein VN673_08985 [Clostridia bacterium]|nr:hypothetical protein [Clostridia bacterium]